MFQTQSSKFKLHAHAQAILFIQSGFNSNVFVGGSLVDIYAKCANMEGVWSMFNKMQSENVIYWNAILRACDTHGHGKEFLKHFGQMFEKGVISYVITIVCLLSTCMLATLVDEGMCYYASMITTYMIFAKLGYKDQTQKQKETGWKLSLLFTI
jgi:pentatricopeptide repeat protein